MPAPASNPAGAGALAAWPGSCRPRPLPDLHVRSAQRSESGARREPRNPAISNGAVAVGEGVAAARLRPANPDRRRARTSHPGHRVKGRPGSRAVLGSSVAATGAQIHREATRRRHPPPPIRHRIRIGAGGAGVGVEGVARGLAVQHRAEVPPAVQAPADVARTRNTPE
jgi:hypothetical protein